jgi:hypothetical protein
MIVAPAQLELEAGHERIVDVSLPQLLEDYKEVGPFDLKAHHLDTNSRQPAIEHEIS